MAETTADVRRDIELTRERMSSTLAQLEQKMNVTQIVKDHPWPALAVAFGAGVLLSGSRADIKAAAVTATATKGASSRIGNVLDDVVANLMTGLTAAFHGHIDTLVTDLKTAIGAPTGNGSGAGSGGGGTRTPSVAGSQVGLAGGTTTGGTHTGGTTGGGMSASGGSTGEWAPQTSADLSVGSTNALRAD